MLNPRTAFLALALAVALAACGASSTPVPAPTATPSPSAAATPAPSGALVTVELRGGGCLGPTCGQTVTIEQGGLVRIAAKPPNELGTVNPINLVALQAAVAATDFSLLRTHKFSGTCPTAVDGPELVLTFATPKGDEVLAACTTQLDFTWPVLAALVTALAPIWPLPHA
jgi:hypothetical protein